MDHLHTRLDALEHQIQALHQQTRAARRRLRFWRSLACGLIMLALGGWTLQAATAPGESIIEGPGSLTERLAALEQKLRYLTVVIAADGLPEVRITGANLRVVNGLGRTDCSRKGGERPCPNGLGNFIVGYNEPREKKREKNIRTGSHNIVVGMEHDFSSYGGLVVGYTNTITGEFAVVSGGRRNIASGWHASVSGGNANEASGSYASVSGGTWNKASGPCAAISGGKNNEARRLGSVSRGMHQTDSGEYHVHPDDGDNNDC